MDFMRNVSHLCVKMARSKKEADEMEREAFTTVDGVLLETLPCIIDEYVLLCAHMASDSGEKMDYEKHQHFRILLKNLSYAIDNIDDYDVDIIKKMIVYIGLELGSKVSFYSTFKKMLVNNELDCFYEINKDDFNFDYLYNELNYGKGKGL